MASGEKKEEERMKGEPGRKERKGPEGEIGVSEDLVRRILPRSPPVDCAMFCPSQRACLAVSSTPMLGRVVAAVVVVAPKIEKTGTGCGLDGTAAKRKPAAAKRDRDGSGLGPASPQGWLCARCRPDPMCLSLVLADECHSLLPLLRDR